jgi:CheY-like chemotaxis protein/signal transduction histidine kinase/HAMP domain-containing protein
MRAAQRGDLAVRLSARGSGLLRELAEAFNALAATNEALKSEMVRVERVVGREGRMAERASLDDLKGGWAISIGAINALIGDLVQPTTEVARVISAVAAGDLTQKMALEIKGQPVKGEFLRIGTTVNSMVDQLNAFASEVTRVAREVGTDGKLGGQATVKGVSGVWKDLTDNVNRLAGNLTTQVRAISNVATAVTKGDLTRSVQVEAQGEVAALKDNINQMIINLRETTQKSTEQDWLKTNLAKFSGMMQSQKNLQTVSRLIMSELTPLVGAQHGAFFMMDTEAGSPVFKLVSSYAYQERKNLSNRFRLGESLVGQCALEKKPILLTKVPPDYIQIGSGLGEGTPLNILVLPVLFEGDVKAVIELASFDSFSAIHQLFLDQVRESIGVVLNMISASTRTEQLLLQSQSLTEELQNQSRELTEQQEELKRTNVALEKQALELEEKAKLLEEQNRKVEIKNREVEQARVALEEKAEQLSLISKYKSEFLANMSHELRTPLNSLLILAKLLAENEQGNLSDKQVEYAKTIYGSGGDLLSLINEILDLSKVEAGKMEVQPREVVLSELQDFAERQFRPIAQHNGVDFEIVFASDLPSAIRSDPQRLQQILKNLLGNAFKFTQTGAVRLKVCLASRSSRFSGDALSHAERVIAFAVEDTGIGIAKDKQRIIFEAFQQADGTTSRQYGGTGLGLSISREFARLLGGEIAVESELGKGSVFTLYLPDRFVPTEESLAHAGSENARSPEVPKGVPSVVWQYEAQASRPVEDDRASIAATDRVLLIVEDDSKFARILLGVAREEGFKGVVASRGDTALFLAEKLQPTAITLDIRLPVVDGWSVLERLKNNPRTRHIPVHVISIVERTNRSGMMGAFAYLEKPVSREAIQNALSEIGDFLVRTPKELLLVEDDSTQRSTIAELIQGEDVRVTAVRSAEEALSALQSSKFDCVVVDLVLPGLDGFRLIDSIKAQARFSDLSIIVYTSKDLSHDEQQQLQKSAVSVIVKSSTQSAERLLNDASLFLHRVDKTTQLAPRVSDEEASADGLLAGKKVLVVDDDVRNLFAIISALESHNAEVIFAETGSAALELLQKNTDVDAVLMDLMMPGMDGFEAIRQIRHQARHESLPIIAVTAKALKDDYDKCVQAGASDYLPKPVDPDRLVEMIRLWTRV